MWTHFTGISDREMRILVESEAETALHAFSTRIFSEEGRRHVSVLGYTGEGIVRRRATASGQTVTSQQGILRAHHNKQATYPLEGRSFPAIPAT